MLPYIRIVGDSLRAQARVVIWLMAWFADGLTAVCQDCCVLAWVRKPRCLVLGWLMAIARCRVLVSPTRVRVGARSLG